MRENKKDISDTMETLLEKVKIARLDLLIVQSLLHTHWDWDFLMNTTELWYINDILDTLSKQIAWLRRPPIVR